MGEVPVFGTIQSHQGRETLALNSERISTTFAACEVRVDYVSQMLVAGQKMKATEWHGCCVGELLDPSHVVWNAMTAVWSAVQHDKLHGAGSTARSGAMQRVPGIADSLAPPTASGDAQPTGRRVFNLGVPLAPREEPLELPTPPLEPNQRPTRTKEAPLPPPWQHPPRARSRAWQARTGAAEPRMRLPCARAWSPLRRNTAKQKRTTRRP
eukprot:6212927-Pleurochrysis_carterae.AAC.2